MCEVQDENDINSLLMCIKGLRDIQGVLVKISNRRPASFCPDFDDSRDRLRACGHSAECLRIEVEQAVERVREEMKVSK